MIVSQFKTNDTSYECVEQYWSILLEILKVRFYLSVCQSQRLSFGCRQGTAILLLTQNEMGVRLSLADPRGTLGMQAPLRPISFIFISAKILSNHRFSLQTQGLAPPFWKILDPPLVFSLSRYNDHLQEIYLIIF